MEKNNKQKRIRYPLAFKKAVLIGISRGRKFDDILKDFGYDSSDMISNDKKYAEKLLHKWRKEMYADISMLVFDMDSATDAMIECEIESMGSDDEFDFIDAQIKEYCDDEP